VQVVVQEIEALKSPDATSSETGIEPAFVTNSFRFSGRRA